MSANLIQSTELDTEKFPYRFLLRWSWPDHVETSLRRLLWTWLAEEKEPEGTNGALTRMSDYIAMHVLWLIAVHPESPGAVLDLIASQESVALKERVAENPNTWPSTLKKMATHVHPTVRVAVAQNRNTSDDVFSMLAADEHVEVRYAVAECHDREGHALEQLLDDENVYVAARAKRTLSRLCPTPALQLPVRIKDNGGSQYLKKTAEG